MRRVIIDGKKYPTYVLYSFHPQIKTDMEAWLEKVAPEAVNFMAVFEKHFPEGWKSEQRLPIYLVVKDRQIYIYSNYLPDGYDFI